jgi:hypothetical protein
MGKGRRRRKQRRANFQHFQTYHEEEQQQASLGAQTQRELRFSCISHDPSRHVSTTLEGVKHFCSQVGAVTACFQVNARDSKGQGRPGWRDIIEAVVEMAAGPDAATILKMRQKVYFQGRVDDRALATSFGFLRSSSCPRCLGRGKALGCSCPTYCK